MAVCELRAGALVCAVCEQSHWRRIFLELISNGELA
jgi:hypothetical protein